MRIEEAVFKRKSIRKYSSEKFDKESISKVEKMIEDAKGFRKDIDLKGFFVEDGKKVQKLFQNFISKYIKVNSPHYIIITSEEKDGYLENSGFAFEEVILKLTTFGAGTCWVGAPFNREMVKDIVDIPGNHIPVIIIALGEPEDFFTMYREDISEFKREKLETIAQGDSLEGLQEALEYLRVAPSGINSQPWRVRVEDENIHVMCVERKNFLTKKLYEKMNLIDMGIGLQHLKIGLVKNGYTFILEDKNLNNEKNQKYLTSIKYKKD